MSDDYEQAAKALRGASNAIASTGAGISVESGIADFRSPGGVWSIYPPEEYATIQAFLADPAKVWNLWYDLGQRFSGCEPNAAHQALARLEHARRLTAIITQNVDDLHQRAGSRRVIEYHGNARRLVCLECPHHEPFDPSVRQEVPLRCQCGGLLKPDVVMFGELIPQKAMLQAEAYARTADVVIIVGTSAQVFPAAQIPLTAKEHGAFIIEANLEPTDFTSTVTDIFLQGRAGETLPRLADLVIG